MVLSRLVREPTPETVSVKIQQFNEAIARYEGHRRYQVFGLLVATSIAVSEAILACMVVVHPFDLGIFLVVAVVAYLAADFVNGMVHLWMDNDDDYASLAGPLVAQFHLHHRTPRYRRRPLIAVYFLEGGSKVWLALLLVAVVAGLSRLPTWLVQFFACFGVFSSLAEVSHYLCHTSNSKVAGFLGKIRILLPKHHLELHHRQDNRSYCFLNGLCDPVIDWIAARFFRGYKQSTDLHYAQYVPPSQASPEAGR